MAQAYVPEKTSAIAAPVRGGSMIGLAMLLLLTGLVFFAVQRMNPPAAVSSQSPATVFSSGRAMEHVKAISERPRPVGSVGHQRARDYILNQLTASGLTPEVQQTTFAGEMADNFFRAGSVQNIVARLDGADPANTKAILLVGHYDSGPNTFGASDDGAAVAALLETLRALKAGEPLRNDCIFLFTDAEEVGSLGAEAFVSQHPWVRDVGLVLNFEARGTGGPVVMFETSGQNRGLIGEFARAVPHPLTNSLLYEVYRVLPNDTDMTVFKEAGLAGLNFAYINEPTRYHSQLDNFENIDERSLQHHGSYALSLTRHFGNQNLDASRSTGNAVYFDVLGLALAHYSGVWVLPLTILVTLLFAGGVVLGLRRRILTLPGMLLGAAVFLLNLLIVPAAVKFVWWLIRTFHSDYKSLPRGDVYNSQYYLLGFVALTIAIVSALYLLSRKKVSVENLAAGALLVWVVSLALCSFFVPGGSYLLTWPLLGSLFALAFTLATRRQPDPSSKQLLVLAAGALPAIILFVPLIYLLFVALTIKLAWAVTIVLVLLLGLLIPHLNLITKRSGWLMPGTLAIVSVVLMVVGVSASGYNSEQPKQNDIFYGLDADTGRAVWASTDEKADEWTSQFISDEPETATLEAFFPGVPMPFLTKQAPAASLAAPEAKALDDSSKDGVRTLRLLIKSPRRAPLMSVYADPGTEFSRVAVNGRQVAPNAKTGRNAEAEEPWMLRYFAVPEEGIELVLDTKSAAPFKLRVVDQSYGLPQTLQAALKSRPDYMMPLTSPYSDATLVGKSFTF